jgi:zinc transport system substrate-binding protein
VGEWVERRKLTCHHDHGGHDHDHAHHHHGDDDPHVWLDPERAAKIVTRLGDEFARLDAAHAAGYKQRAQAYAAKLTELSGELTKLKGSLNGKKVVTFHDAYGYLFERLGVEVVGVVQVAPGVEPSLRDVQEALKLMKSTGQKAAFAEPGAENSAQTIAKELNLKVAILDPLETTSSGKTYVERMKQNLKVLEEHLK